jgi:hypothetical protein
MGEPLISHIQSSIHHSSRSRELAARSADQDHMSWHLTSPVVWNGAVPFQLYGKLVVQEFLVPITTGYADNSNVHHQQSTAIERKSPTCSTSASGSAGMTNKVRQFH